MILFMQQIHIESQTYARHCISNMSEQKETNISAFMELIFQ